MLMVAIPRVNRALSLLYWLQTKLSTDRAQNVQGVQIPCTVHIVYLLSAH